jgi:hypothetical protein
MRLLLEMNTPRSVATQSTNVVFLFVLKKTGGFLGASPDGLVGENKIIEIKCPYSARYLHPLDIPKNIKTFYCSLDDDGKLKVNKKT